MMGNIAVFLIGLVVGYAISVIVDGKYKPKYVLKTYDEVWGANAYLIDSPCECSVSKNLSDAKRFDTIDDASAYNQKELDGGFEIMEVINWEK